MHGECEKRWGMMSGLAKLLQRFHGLFPFLFGVGLFGLQAAVFLAACGVGRSFGRGQQLLQVVELGFQVDYGLLSLADGLLQLAALAGLGLLLLVAELACAG